MHKWPSTDSYTIINIAQFYLTFLLLIFSIRPMPVFPKYFTCTIKNLAFLHLTSFQIDGGLLK